MGAGGHSNALLNTGGLSVAESCTDLGEGGFHHPEILSVQQVSLLLHHRSVLLATDSWL